VNFSVSWAQTAQARPPPSTCSLAWTGIFFIKSGGRLESIQSLLPGVVAVSILFGITSMLAVTVTFEKNVHF
jgi:hypothetical protein